jgi:hypothetical protein
VNFPGISFEMPMQIRMRGKERNFKPAKNPQDIITTRQLQVTFRSVDSDLNYWLLFDILNKHYLDTENQWLDPFTITALDIHRDAIYVIKFYEIIINSINENMFNYSQQKVQSKDFVVSINFNFYDVEFLLDKSKVLELGSLPQVIQKI